MNAFNSPIEDTDMSVLPTSDPGSSRPWRHPQFGIITVGPWIDLATTEYVDGELNAALANKANVLHSHVIADVSGLQAAIDAKQNNLGFTPINKAGDTNIGSLSSTGHFIAGLTAINYSAAGLKLGAAADIEFAPTSVDGTTDFIIIRNGVGQVDFRGNAGVRVRNAANDNFAPLLAGTATFVNGNTNLSIDVSGDPQINTGGGNTQNLTIVGGKTILRATNGVDIGPNADVNLQRVNAAQLDVRANNGLRVRNQAGSASAPIDVSQVILANGIGVGIGWDGNWGMQLFTGSGMTSMFVIRTGTPGVLTGPISIGNADPRGNADITLLRNSTSQLDIRADNGVRLRNLANNADAPITALNVTATPASVPGAYTSNVSISNDWAASRYRSAGSQVADLATWGNRLLWVADVGGNSRCGVLFDLTNADNVQARVFGGRQKGFGIPVPITFGEPTVVTTLAGSQVNVSGLFGLGTFTVATLPSASANAGKSAEVTDSSVTAYRSIVTGGGTERVDVKSNGTNWLVN